MIGHVINILDEAAEDRILTSQLAPGASLHDDGSRCLGGAIVDVYWDEEQGREKFAATFPFLAAWRDQHSRKWRTNYYRRYDALCGRFGPDRINRAIRNRILSNRAWRALRAPVLAHS